MSATSIADQPEPRERMVQVVRWYLSAFHAGRKGSVAKKPYNPILGEVFYCHWDLPNETETPPPAVRAFLLCLCQNSRNNPHSLCWPLTHTTYIIVIYNPSSMCLSFRRLYQKVQFRCVQLTVWALLQSRSLTTHPVSIGSFWDGLWWKHSHSCVKFTFSLNQDEEFSCLFRCCLLVWNVCISFVLSAVSAFYAECLSKKIQFNAHIWTKSKFLGMSIGVHNIGQGIQITASCTSTHSSQNDSIMTWFFRMCLMSGAWWALHCQLPEWIWQVGLTVCLIANNLCNVSNDCCSVMVWRECQRGKRDGEGYRERDTESETGESNM